MVAVIEPPSCTKLCPDCKESSIDFMIEMAASRLINLTDRTSTPKFPDEFRYIQ